MFSKLIFLSFIALIEAAGLCPDATGAVGQGSPVTGGVECELIPGCNFPDNGTLTPLATQCSNELPDVDCNALFPCVASTTAGEPNCNQLTPIAGTDGPSYPMVRAAACNSPGVRDVALKCAKTCALCCQAPEFDCADDSKSPVDCELNKGKCKDANWTDIMAQYCPMTCGLCDEGGCRDLNSGCNTVTELCKNVDFIDYMRANCARTCDFCATTSGCTNKATNCAENANLCTNDIYRQLMQEQCCATCGGTSGGGSTSCIDSSTSCTTWVRNGFCTSSYYTSDQKRQYCGRSCNLC